MYIRTCTFCVVRHTVMCMYVVSNMEKLISVIVVARATHPVCWCSVVAAGVI